MVRIRLDVLSNCLHRLQVILDLLKLLISLVLNTFMYRKIARLQEHLDICVKAITVCLPLQLLHVFQVRVDLVWLLELV